MEKRRPLTLYVMNTSMRKNDRNTCAPYTVARLKRMVSGIGVLMHHRQHPPINKHADSAHLCCSLTAGNPVNKPAASLSMPGELRPLTDPPRALPLPCALSVAAMRRSATVCATRSHSYSTPSAAIARQEKKNAWVVLMCHDRKTMQVSSIWVFLERRRRSHSTRQEQS